MRQLKVCLVAPPFSGHLHPVLGLARMLDGVAETCVISTPSALAAVAASGLRGRQILPDREELIHEIVSPGRPVRSHPLLLYRQLRANVSLQGEMLTALESVFAEERPDLVIADFTVPVAGVAAERIGCPWWSSVPSPCVFETPDGPPAYCGGLRPARNDFEAAQHRVLRAGVRVFKHLMFLTFRRTFRAAGLTSVYRADGTERVYSPHLILGLSLPELEFPRTYPERFHLIGPVLFTPPGPDAPPSFIEQRKHVLISLGTHLAHHKEEAARVVRQLARDHPDWIFHLTDGQAGGGRREIEGNFHRYSFVSYAGQLARYDLVIHHAGTGILFRCLQHGLPAVVLPLDFDQFDYAARLVHAGAAVRARGFDDLPRAFAEATTRIVELQARACGLQAAMRSRDPAAFLRAEVLRSLRGRPG